jgi:hypothetical protein
MPGGSSSAEEGFDFSEEEAAEESAPGEELVFSEEEVDVPDSENGFDFTDDAESEPEEGFDFSEEDVQEDLPDDENNQDPWTQTLPKPGYSDWRITNEVGTMDCTDIQFELGPESEELGRIQAGPEPDLDVLIAEGVTEEGELYFYKDYSQTAVYTTVDYIPPGGTSEVVYEMTFYNLNGGEYADSLEGTISGTIEETVQGIKVQCNLFRSFYGYTVEND